MSASAHYAASAKIRTDLKLIGAAPTLQESEKDALRSAVLDELADLYVGSLGPLHINYPPRSLERIGIEADMSLEEKKDLFGFSLARSAPSKEERLLQKMLVNGAKSTLAQSWAWRAGEAARELIDWYPFFVTLTVDPKRYNPRELWQETTAWRDYVRRLAVVSMKAAGLTRSEIKKTSTRDYLQYMATIEHGRSGVHDHAHMLVWLRAVPESWKRDPNGHMASPTNRRCPPLETYWPYCDPGQRPAIYFWFEGCIWQRVGHKVPQAADGKGLVLLPPECAGGYVSKYMAKEKKQWLHRMKATHGLGMSRLTKTLLNLAFEELEALGKRPPSYELNHLLQTTLSVPIGLLRSTARMLTYRTSYRQMTLKELTRIRPNNFEPMRRSVQNGARPWQMLSKERYDWLSSVLPPDPSGFCEKSFRSAVESMLACFPSQEMLRQNGVAGLK